MQTATKSSKTDYWRNEQQPRMEALSSSTKTLAKRITWTKGNWKGVETEVSTETKKIATTKQKIIKEADQLAAEGAELKKQGQGKHQAKGTPQIM